MSLPRRWGRAVAAALITAAAVAATIDELTGSGQSASSPAMSVRVVDVIDGDTVRVDSLEGVDLGRVRLLGIGAPELAHDGQEAECFAQDSRHHLRRLLGRDVTVELTPDPGEPDRDVYGRLLRYLDVDDVDVSEALLTQGAVRRYPGQLDRGRAYDAAVITARAAQSGLYAAC